ncbi:MAG TPA: hypothetical protein PLL64_05210, partial [Rhodothermales bacterium]|nr:hypothetical protein [Rhodothermales bacterium]
MKPEPHIIRNLILTVLSKNKNQSFRPKDLAKRLNIRDQKAYLIFQKQLSELVAEGHLAKVSGGKIQFQDRMPHL